MFAPISLNQSMSNKCSASAVKRRHHTDRMQKPMLRSKGQRGEEDIKRQELNKGGGQGGFDGKLVEIKTA